MLKSPKFRDIELELSSRDELDSWMSTLKSTISQLPKEVPSTRDRGRTGENKGENKAVFGVPLVETMTKQRAAGSPLDVPQVIAAAFAYLDQPGLLQTEGLFRLSGSAVTINQLKAQANEGSQFPTLIPGRPVDLSNVNDPHAVTGLLKLYIRELPEPLCPFDFYDRLVRLSPSSNSFLSDFRSLLLQFPPDHMYTSLRSFTFRVLLRRLMELLHRTSQWSDANKMTVSNLAIVIAPNLLHSRHGTPFSAMEDSQVVNELTSQMITHHSYLFGTH